MATRLSVLCLLCQDEMGVGKDLEDHLLEAHTKRELAKFVTAETEAFEEEDISE